MTDGLSPTSVLHSVRSLTPWIIRGNREEYLLRIQDGRTSEEAKFSHQFASVWWTYDQLAPEDMAWLEALPAERRASCAGVTVRMVQALRLACPICSINVTAKKCTEQLAP